MVVGFGIVFVVALDLGVGCSLSGVLLSGTSVPFPRLVVIIIKMYEKKDDPE